MTENFSSRTVTVHLLPAHFEPGELRGSIAVVIDVLRATTTVATALANRAQAVIPCLTVEDALAEKSAGRATLLGGERECQLIPGFDLGNSPTEWSADVVADRAIAFTTTNGTRALLRAVEADRIVTAAFANLSAVVALLAADLRPVHLVCAGTVGKISSEDTLVAGALVDRLVRSDPSFEIRDAALLARHHWLSCCESEAAVAAEMRRGQGGRNLTGLGMGSDIELAARLDQVDLVPEYSPESRRICRSGT